MSEPRVAVFEATTTKLFDNASAFTAFLASTNQKRVFTRHFDGVIREIIASPAMVASFGLSPLIVDVGIGEGTLAAQYLAHLRQTFPDLRFIGIDPAPGMTAACHQKLYGDGHVKEGDALITELFFDHPSGQLPRQFNNKQANLVIGSHVMYYAHDIPKAVAQFEELCGDNGIAYFVTQSSQSQMHQLRAEFSHSIHTLRQADGAPNCSDHIAAAVSEESRRIPQLAYSSQLFFPQNHNQYFEFLTEMLQSDVERHNWADYATQSFDTTWAEECSRVALVMEFILRDKLDADPSNSIKFSGRLRRLIESNGLSNSGEPFISISESAVFSSSPKLAPTLAQAVTAYKRAIGSGTALDEVGRGKENSNLHQ